MATGKKITAMVEKLLTPKQNNHHKEKNYCSKGKINILTASVAY